MARKPNKNICMRKPKNKIKTSKIYDVHVVILLPNSSEWRRRMAPKKKQASGQGRKKEWKKLRKKKQIFSANTAHGVSSLKWNYVPHTEHDSVIFVGFDSVATVFRKKKHFLVFLAHKLRHSEHRAKATNQTTRTNTQWAHIDFRRSLTEIQKRKKERTKK